MPSFYGLLTIRALFLTDLMLRLRIRLIMPLCSTAICRGQSRKITATAHAQWRRLSRSMTVRTRSPSRTEISFSGAGCKILIYRKANTSYIIRSQYANSFYSVSPRHSPRFFLTCTVFPQIVCRCKITIRDDMLFISRNISLRAAFLHFSSMK